VSHRWAQPGIGSGIGFFRAQKVEREALAALQLFCEAAKRRTATAERVVKFLHRAQHDPELRFDDDSRE
jgi:hypothetical protein